jgi:hypothetical protein
MRPDIAMMITFMLLSFGVISLAFFLFCELSMWREDAEFRRQYAQLLDRLAKRQTPYIGYPPGCTQGEWDGMSHNERVLLIDQAYERYG